VPVRRQTLIQLPELSLLKKQREADKPQYQRGGRKLSLTQGSSASERQSGKDRRRRDGREKEVRSGVWEVNRPTRIRNIERADCLRERRPAYDVLIGCHARDRNKVSIPGALSGVLTEVKEEAAGGGI